MRRAIRKFLFGVLIGALAAFIAMLVVGIAVFLAIPSTGYLALRGPIYDTAPVAPTDNLWV